MKWAKPYEATGQAGLEQGLVASLLSMRGDLRGLGNIQVHNHSTACSPLLAFQLDHGQRTKYKKDLNKEIDFQETEDETLV